MKFLKAKLKVVRIVSFDFLLQSYFLGDNTISSLLYLILLANIKKPLNEWTADEVQQWFQKNDFSEYYPKFKGLSGKLLSELSENNFLRRCPEVGDALYNIIQKLKAQVNKGIFFYC